MNDREQDGGSSETPVSALEGLRSPTSHQCPELIAYTGWSTPGLLPRLCNRGPSTCLGPARHPGDPSRAIPLKYSEAIGARSVIGLHGVP